jgi:hypothetical protein
MECISGLEAVPLDYGLQDVLARQGLQFEPWVGAAAASFTTKLPIPSSCSIFSSEGYFRLKRHHRSICFAPKTGEPIRSLFCIKGMKPLAPDFDSALDRWAARHMPNSGLNLLETFVLMEDKLRVAIGRSTGVFIIRTAVFNDHLYRWTERRVGVNFGANVFVHLAGLIETGQCNGRPARSRWSSSRRRRRCRCRTVRRMCRPRPTIWSVRCLRPSCKRPAWDV